MARVGCVNPFSSSAPLRARGFSLVELLVVVSIVALMVGMLLPSLKRSIRIANATVCMHNLREVGQSLQVYRIENGGFLPNVHPGYPVAPASEPAEWFEDGPVREVWFLKLWPNHLPDLNALSCPEDPFRMRLSSAKEPVLEPDLSDYSSYGINGFIMLAGGGYLTNLDRYQPTRPLDTILLADAGPDFASHRPIRADESGPKRNDSILAWDDGSDPTYMESSGPWVTKRHGAKINALTIAGGVREIRTTELSRNPVVPFYSSCAAGGCTLCVDLRVPHYSFAQDQVFWWTGSVPAE
jgi:prepilin-type N-terminal cleavage/methylation domain-containing protein